MFPNLLLLCPPHHKPVDDNESDYTVDELEQWKVAQVAQQGQTLSAPDLAAIVEQVAGSAISNAGAASVVGLARAARLLIESGRRERDRPLRAVLAWQVMYERVRSSHVVWDSNGERLYAEPSRRDTQEHRARVIAALDEATAALSPLEDTVHGELQAVRAAHPGLEEWCAWVDRASRAVIDAASRWPTPPPFEDNDAWPDALAELERAINALTAKWRGEDAAEPPEPPIVAVEPEVDPRARQLTQHADLLDSARPWARVDHRPYDEPLYRQLCDAMQVAISLPPTLSALSMDINATANLAAAVARNADDSTSRLLINDAAQRRPVAIAAALLRSLAITYKKADRDELHLLAMDAATTALTSQEWNDRQTWVENENYGRQVLDLTASVTSNGHVQKTLGAALRADPGLLAAILPACASWIERRDFDDWSVTGIVRQYGNLPDWFPTVDVVREIKNQFPNLVPADEWEADHIAEESSRLASQVLNLASALSPKHPLND
jgi:hypothetical protein